MGLILLPIGFSIFYITVLTAFVAPTKDYNNISSILTKIHPVAWSKKQPQLEASPHKRIESVKLLK
jgi:hypothetical protein